MDVRSPATVSLFAVALLAAGCAAPDAARTPADPGPVRIAVGSCLQQNAPQPIWDAVQASHPDLFVFLGDNIYGDTEDMGVMRRKYDALGAEPGFRAVRAQCPVLATWDDHDYGVNDGGAEYPMKEASKAEFLRFFRIPDSHPVRDRPGIYRDEMLVLSGFRVQVLLLDTRTFRGPLRRVDPRPSGRGPYLPGTDPTAPLLGDAQWAWLESALRQPADLRLLASSIQVIPDEHGWEAWSNFPTERARLYRLLRETNASGVIVLSGDRHHGGLSRADAGLGYPLYELTASGMNRAMRRPVNEPNRHKVYGPFVQNHFGMVRIAPTPDGPMVHLELVDEAGDAAQTHAVPLATLR